MNAIVKIFNYRFYVKEILLVFATYLLMEGIFSWLFMPVSLVVLAYEKGLSLLIYGFMLYSYLKLKSDERIYVGLFTLYILKLIFESLFEYGTPVRQFTMFTVLYPVIFVVFIKYICRQYDLDLLEFIAKFYLATYIAFMAIYGHQFSLSLDAIEMNDYGPFSGDGRIIHARSVFMLIIPLVWFLHQYTLRKKLITLLIVLFCATAIIMHQHRSVWSSALVALMLYGYISIRNNKNVTGKFLSILMGSLMMLLVVYFTCKLIREVMERNGEMITLMTDRKRQEAPMPTSKELVSAATQPIEEPEHGRTQPSSALNNPVRDEI